MSNDNNTNRGTWFESIDDAQLDAVAGGAPKRGTPQRGGNKVSPQTRAPSSNNPVSHKKKPWLYQQH